MAQNWTPPAAASAPADDPWAKFTASNSVDWARGGFDQPDHAPAPPPQPVAPQPIAFTPAAPTSDAAWTAFLAASGMAPDLVKSSPTEAASAAGALLKRLVAGLVVMMEARARAKSQLGAQSTTLELNGNNPLKFARSPEKVLAQLINPPERGFMDAGMAIEDSFQDLQAHQMATLAAMQGALRSTLERFSPEAIRSRAETRGLLAKIIPSARNAALWDAYQREFEGVARGSDEAFLDVFAKAFKAAYEQAAADMKRRR
jgi:type VI secretion system FHA domain protein